MCMNMQCGNASDWWTQMEQFIHPIYEYCMKKLPLQAILSKF